MVQTSKHHDKAKQKRRVSSNPADLNFFSPPKNFFSLLFFAYLKLKINLSELSKFLPVYLAKQRMWMESHLYHLKCSARCISKL